jgi:hypothetical protein
MNRLERTQLLDRVAKAEAVAQDVQAELRDALRRIAVLEIGLGGTIPLAKAKEGNANGNGTGRSVT